MSEWKIGDEIYFFNMDNHQIQCESGILAAMYLNDGGLKKWGIELKCINHLGM